MNKFTGIALATWLGCLALLCHAGVAQAQVAEVAELAGSPEVLRGAQPAELLALGDPLFEADTVRTDARSRVTLAMQDGSRLSIDQSSRVAIQNYATTGQPEAVLQVFRGRMRSVVSDTFSRRRNAFRVRTSTAVVGVQGTDFLVEALAASTRITVYEGVVEVVNADPAVRGSQTLVRRQTVLVRRGEPPPPPTELVGTNLSPGAGSVGLASGGSRDRNIGDTPWAPDLPGGGGTGISSPLPAVVVPPDPNVPR